MIESSWLVQRLRKPTQAHALLGADNPFAFGGGYKNGGLSDDAMGLLRGIFSFDYMGSAEFEFGEVPKALNRIANRATNAASVLTVPLAEVAAHWKDESKKKPDGQATVFLICDPADREEVEARIRCWASKSYGENLKESTNLARALRPVDEWDSDTQGWLELDNGFFFFTDREMWERTCDLFGIDRGTDLAEQGGQPT